jgi:acetyl-CoA carboxylase alpha subunit
VDPFQIAQTIRSAITRHLTELDGISTKVLRAKRFEKFSRMGQITTIK